MRLSISAGPHLHASQTTARLMLHVLLALVPPFVAAIYLFGENVLIHTVVCVASCVAVEYLCCLLRHKKPTIGDLSAVITGVLTAFALPAEAPFWYGAFAAVFSIGIAKQLFGGLGRNFINPALFARAVLLSCFPENMTLYTRPVRTLFAADAISQATDAVSSATVLSGGTASLFDRFIGNIAGCPGEVCKAAILLGFLILAVTGTIRWHIPVIVVGAFAVTAWALGMDPLTACLSGSMLFGAVYMATDYVTSPMLITSQCIYAALIGILIALIRRFGSYPEGTTYAIMLMNIVTPLLDKYTHRRIYGEVKKA